MSWIATYLFKSTFGSQGFKLFAFISCFITKTLIVWLCIKTTNNYAYKRVTICYITIKISKNSKFDKNVSNSSDNWIGERWIKVILHCFPYTLRLKFKHFFKQLILFTFIGRKSLWYIQIQPRFWFDGRSALTNL